MTRIYDIADRYVTSFAALDPLSATRAGIAGHDTEMTDYAPDGFDARAELDRRTLRDLAEAPVTSERDRIARDFMTERLESAVELADAGDRYLSVRVIGSPLAAPRQVFDGMARATESDWQTIASRLKKLPTSLTSYRVTIEEGFEKGLVNARRQLSEGALQCEVWSGDTGKTPFFESLLESYDESGVASAGLRSDLASACDAATSAYASLGSYLRARTDRGVEADGCGRERYARNARNFLGADLDLDETYRWGWEDLRHIRSEMDAVAQKILPGATVDEAVAHLDADPSRFVESVEEYRTWLQDEHDGALQELQGTHFDIDPRGMRVEVRIPPPGGAMAAYYTGPSEDWSRPGRTWWPVGTATRFARWRFISTAYHEGVPGHHLDYASRRSLETELSRFQRTLGFVSGYSEGWALYAERLMGELGYLEIPEYYLGMLKAQAWRAARVIVDIGMHLGLSIPRAEAFNPGKTWDATLAADFMVECTSNSREFMESEVVRYLGWPAQAISYKVGERYWLEAREAARARMATDFNLKRFHTEALNLGPLGLDQLRRELA